MMPDHPVIGYAQSGLTIREAAQEMGVGYEAARARACRQGVRLTHERARSVIQTAEGMPLREGFDFLAMCLMDAAGALCGEAHPVDDAMPHLTPILRRMAVTLWDAQGGIVSHDRLMSACDFGSRDQVTTIGSLRAHITRLRARAPKGVSIHNVHGQGYVFERAKGVVFQAKEAGA